MQISNDNFANTNRAVLKPESITVLRLIYDLYVKDLANQAGIWKNELSAIENGRRAITPFLQEKILKAFNYNTDDETAKKLNEFAAAAKVLLTKETAE